jgi:hypothetical protein
MVVLTANESVQAFLGQAKEKAEVRSPEGRLLGHFEPHQETEQELYERAKKLFDPKEFERRLATEKDQGLTFDQVMEHLRSLEPKK